MSDTIEVFGTYKVGVDEHLDIDADRGFELRFDETGRTELDCAGAVRVTNSESAAGVLASDVDGEAMVRIRPTGRISVTNRDWPGSAVGLSLGADNSSVFNAGRLEATAEGESASGIVVSGQYATVHNAGYLRVSGATHGYGVQIMGGLVDNDGVIKVVGFDGGAWAVIGYGDCQVENSGVIRAQGYDEAVGVRLLEGADVVNRGLISAAAAGGAAGVALLNEGRVVNFGSIVATADEGGQAVGVAAEADGGPVVINNQGFIEAQIAVSAGGTGAVTIVDDGRISGDIHLGSGDDQIRGSGYLSGQVSLGGGDDIFDLGAGKFSGLVQGEGGDDLIIGAARAEAFDGGDGADHMEGRGGADALTGGLGADVFGYSSVSDSIHAGADFISDLEEIDQIDLSAIDADVDKAGDQAFHLVAAFDGHAGQLVLRYSSKLNMTVIAGDVDGNGRADLLIHANGDHTEFAGFVL